MQIIYTFFFGGVAFQWEYKMRDTEIMCINPLDSSTPWKLVCIDFPSHYCYNICWRPLYSSLSLYEVQYNHIFNYIIIFNNIHTFILYNLWQAGLFFYMLNMLYANIRTCCLRSTFIHVKLFSVLYQYLLDICIMHTLSDLLEMK